VGHSGYRGQNEANFEAAELAKRSQSGPADGKQVVDGTGVSRACGELTKRTQLERG